MGTYTVDTFWERAKKILKWPYWRIQDAWMRVCIMVRWIPMAWKDQDYDWGFILRAMQFKIRRTRIYQEQHGHHADSAAQCAQMKDVEDNIQRILDDNYAMDVIGEHFEKYPPFFRDIETSPGMSEMVHPVAPPDEQQKYERASKARLQLALNDWKMLWNKIEAHMQEWWD